MVIVGNFLLVSPSALLFLENPVDLDIQSDFTSISVSLPAFASIFYMTNNKAIQSQRTREREKE